MRLSTANKTTNRTGKERTAVERASALLLLLILALPAPARSSLGHAEENPSVFPAQTGADIGLEADFTVASSFASHLPLLVVEFSAAGVSDAPEAARLGVYDRPDGQNSLADVPQAVLDIRMRELSERPDGGKGSYQIELAPSAGAAVPARTALVGLPDASQWLLRGSVRDKSMLRASLAYGLGSVLFPDATPGFRYCEVLFKRDDRYRYQGIFLLAESDEQIFESLADRKSGTPILKFSPGQERRGEFAVRSGSKIFMAVQSGPDTEAQREARARAGVDLAKLDGALLAIQPETFLGYETLLDQDSAIDLYILNMLMLNVEDSAVPFHLYSRTDGRFRFIPDWSFDEAIDNRPTRDHPLSFEENFKRIQAPSMLARRVPVWRALQSGGDIRDLRLYPLYQAMGGEKFQWFDRLFLSRSFLTRLYARYREVRRGPLSPLSIRAALDALAFEIGPAIERDWLRWHDKYAAAQGTYALRPFVDADGRAHVRQTWSYDQELVKIGNCLLKQDAFLRDQLERLDWLTADLYDKGRSGNRQAAYAFLGMIGMLTLMHLLSKKLG